MPSWIATPLRLAASCSHRLLGRMFFRLGSADRARRHFERVLDLKGDDFVAYLYLGRLAYSVGDYSGWRRELEHARRTSPERFARTSQSFDLFTPLTAGTLRAEPGERATWRAIRLSSVGGLPPVGRADTEDYSPDYSPDYRDSDAFAGSDAFPGRGPAVRDDFSSNEERRRFQILPPIEARDIEAADIDGLLGRLVGGAEPLTE